MVTTRTVGLFLIMAVLMLGMVPVSIAQESNNLEFTYGKISKIAGDKVVLLVYDYEMESEVEVAFYVNDETVYEGVASLEGLRSSDEIDIEYVEVEGKKIIKNLYKILALEDDETMSDDEE